MIYAIQAGESGPIKFGTAGDPKSRMCGLQTGNAQKLHLLVEVCLQPKHEKMIHSWLRDERVLGEWFMGPKTDDVLKDLQIRRKCHPFLHEHPDDDRYAFWLAVEECQGSCAST